MTMSIRGSSVTPRKNEPYRDGVDRVHVVVKERRLDVVLAGLSWVVVLVGAGVLVSLMALQRDVAAIPRTVSAERLAREMGVTTTLVIESDVVVEYDDRGARIRCTK